MAYTATVTVRDRMLGGRRVFIVTIAETEARDTSEATIEDLPVVGRIVDVHCTRTAGTGATIDPEIGRAATWSDATQDEVWQNGTAAAHIDAQPGKVYYSSNGKLYWRSTPNSSATDHTITSQIIILEGAAA